MGISLELQAPEMIMSSQGTIQAQTTRKKTTSGHVLRHLRGRRYILSSSDQGPERECLDVSARTASSIRRKVICTHR